MSEVIFYGFSDIHVTTILSVYYSYRSYGIPKFIPISPSSELSGDLKESDFIFSHAIAKFQNLVRFE